MSAATQYSNLVLFLEERGRTPSNFASLTHIGIAGAVATATHDSGVGNQVLAAAVTRLELVAVDGSVRTPDSEIDGDTFDAATVSLGALGLVHAVAPEAVPSFKVAQTGEPL